MDVFYFHVRYGCDTLEKYEERDEYGFVSANNFIHAMEQISGYYRDDLISVDIQYEDGNFSKYDDLCMEGDAKAFPRDPYCTRNRWVYNSCSDGC